MSKLDDLKTLAEPRGNRHLNIAAIHYAELLILGDPRSLPATASGKEHRTNPDRMQYLETAVQCLQACASALESEIIVFALLIHKHLPNACQTAFAGKFTRDAIVVGGSFKSKPATELYKLAPALVAERQTQPPWPADAYDKIADPRNVVVHRTNHLIAVGVIALLEDMDPSVLRQQVEDSTACLIACFASLEGLHAVKASWASIDVTKL